MITQTVQGDKSLVDALHRLGNSSARKDLMEQVGAYGVSSTQGRFIDQVDPEGNKWKPSRRAQTKGGQTLRDKGRLFSSFTFAATSSQAEWGTNLIYAGIHHFGGTIKPKNAKSLAFAGMQGMVFAKEVTIPARPYIGFNADDGQEVTAIAHDWIRERLS